jgi:hypothetical protein
MLKKNLEAAEHSLNQERDHLKVSYAKVTIDIFLTIIDLSNTDEERFDYIKAG